MQIIVAEEDGTPVGIVAEFDVLCRAVCQKANLNAGEYRIRDILSLDAVEIGAGTNVLDALKTVRSFLLVISPCLLSAVPMDARVDGRTMILSSFFLLFLKGRETVNCKFNSR